MTGAHRATETAVFVDQSGRRRRVLMIVGVLGGTLMLACAAVLIGGAFSGTRLDNSDRLGSGGSSPSAPATAPDSERSSGEPTATRPPSTRPPTRAATPRARGSAPATPARTTTAGRTPASGVSPSGASRPTAPPATTPATTKAPGTTPAESTTPPTDGEAAHTPPGQTKEPQGAGQDKTQGPKR
ncbi:hypothetical protein FXF51_54875 [Nonomuraea sp. PA05]|uniref:hypothetical protein n=1 Tax=Nonomuraea sp. PA05 TaxID=2604466 RepID=UPI0011D855ED|nr:hypothetical protein [Nonomuraea sp. PA05]TYB50832.1 hypothetical protein FXF51_54875 [Nonomuraea sp. PA05]